MSTSSSQPDCVLLVADANLGEHRDDTTASTTTRDHLSIQVSLCPAPPPLPSKLYVHCPDLTLTVPPRVIRTDEDLFLIRVAMDEGSSPMRSDYFLYTAGNQRRSTLQLLSRPHPHFQDEDVGILSRDGNYTVAALIATTKPEFDLHIFHSDHPKWIYRKVSVAEPPLRFPMLIPDNCVRLRYHETSTVISVGGEAGTMGWVDLWNSILLCDLLKDDSTLRCVPLPVPLDLVTCDHGLGTELGCPTPFRSIAFIKGSGNNPHDCFKLVHLETQATVVPGDKSSEIEPGNISFQMRDWTIVSYTNTAMSTSWKDWDTDCRIKASGITIEPDIKTQLVQCGLLDSTSGQSLHNLLVSHPALDISAAADGAVVYLMARKKYRHPEAWVIALDTRNKTLIGAAEFGTETEHTTSAMYFPSGIAKYITPVTALKRIMLGIF